MKNCESLANAIRERLADEGSRVLFAGRLSGSELELGRAVGVTRQTIVAIERGDYNPTIKLCVEICKALGKTLDQLFWEP